MKKYGLLLCLWMILGACNNHEPDPDVLTCTDLETPYTCKKGQLCCGGCVESDEKNCGMCGNTCGENAVCNDHMCVCGTAILNCGAGFTCCGNECVDTESNSAFCGSCDLACTDGKVCVDGACNLDCPQALMKCEVNGISQCLDTNNNALHCGECNHPCGDGTACIDGTCTVICPVGQRACTQNGITKCIDPASDTNNCGRCGFSCKQGEVCSLGICSLSCPVEQEKCTTEMGLHCVDVRTNAAHCGRCGNVCPTGNACVDGKCSLSCPLEQEMCLETNGTRRCTYTSNDASHCGSCGRACPNVLNDWLHLASSSCSAGNCLLKCIDSYEDKDGLTTNGCEQSRCGNGVVEEWEECDGLKLNDATCEKIMGEGSTGILRCLPDCSDYDTTSCSAPTTCGNNNIDGAEACDSYNLNGKTCADIVGIGSTGKLTCDASCTKFNTTQCSAPTTCNNGILDLGEKCDGTKFSANVSCESIVGIGSKGIVKCSSNCAEYVIFGCSAPAVCGNETIEEGEECDGTALGSHTCASLVGLGSTGILTCSNECTLSTKGCSAASTCGNNKIDGTDVCDGLALNNKTCTDIVGDGSMGVLRCADNCKSYDVSGCTAASSCGDSFIQPKELCDGLKLNDQTCATLIGEGSTGVLKCNNTCTGFITTGCSGISNCGNSQIDEGEVCDGTKLNGASCESLVGVGSTGIVLCGDDCTYYNLNGCTAATRCGNEKLDEGELCEENLLNDNTCETVVGIGSKGTLVCGEGCKHFDVSGCTASQYCGDGSINEHELCDGDNIGAANCTSVVGFGSTGTLKCNATCTGFDIGECSAALTCGNGRLDFDEPCDGILLNNMTCENLVGTGSTGAPQCNATCTGFENGTCTPAETCGNGRVEPSEVCDASAEENPLNSQTCETILGNGSIGALECNPNCREFITKKCSQPQLCGNGIIDDTEFCDESYLEDPLGGYDCADYVGAGSTGTLQCVNCDFVDKLCTPAETCNNGKLDEHEACDDDRFLNDITSCAEYNPQEYGTGSLLCSENCTLDTSQCAPLCGNGKVESAEICDDGNTNSGDGCSEECNTVEDGWICFKDAKNKSACTTSWCKFQYLDASNPATLTAYGRIYPVGILQDGDVLSRLLCGRSSTPSVSWTLGAEELGDRNHGCTPESGCGDNYEYTVTFNKPEINGNYACTFQFTYDAEHWISCSNTGEQSILLVEENTVLTSEWLQTFSITDGNEPEYTPIKIWNFTSNADVNADPSITFQGAFISKLYYAYTEAMNIGAWGNGEAPDFNSKYIQFSLGNQSSYSNIILNFDYNKNNLADGPRKLQVAYYNGDSQIGVSPIFTIDQTARTLQNSGDLEIPIETYENLNLRFAAFDSPNEIGGLLRLANITVSGK